MQLDLFVFSFLDSTTLSNLQAESAPWNSGNLLSVPAYRSHYGEGGGPEVEDLEEEDWEDEEDPDGSHSSLSSNYLILPKGENSLQTRGEFQPTVH
ncbi:unnamed protein product [Protopolystoma xenopodis]|uniref:Uncharacterized protein n=1 Tax=Protopolystoma xenopodis TaxID=117903 RepID=A0A448WXG7_9PLAT|nr:unnamed protein product [Protopolystoma xenopodis]